MTRRTALSIFAAATLGILSGCFTTQVGFAADPDSDPDAKSTSTAVMDLVDAVKRQQRSRIERLLQRELDVNEPMADGATALHWAVHRNDLDTTSRLITAGANVNAKNDLGVTPLSLACTNADEQIIALLIDAGANVNEPLLTGETPLMTASHTGNVVAVQTLLKAGADVNAKEPVREQTALMWALGESQSDVVKVLVEAGAEINATTTLGFNPLMFAARRGDLDSTKLLLDAGAYVNSRSKDKLTTLHVAAQRGHVDVAIELVNRGADVNDAEPGYTALHWAVGTWETEMNGANGMTAPADHEWHRMRGIQDGKLELVRALLEAGADPNVRMKSPPRRFGFTASRPPAGSTAYTLAAFAGEGEIMQVLFENGADPKLKPNNGMSAFLIAAGVNRSTRELSVAIPDLLGAMQAAVEHGADINETDRSGNTALHGAAWLRSIEMVDWLYENGADMNMKNRAGQNALHIADHTGFFAGIGEKVAERLPVGHRIKELSVPAAVKESVEKWADLPPHVRKAVRSLLDGELANLPGGQKSDRGW